MPVTARKISCVRNNRRIIQHERSQKLRNTQQHQSQWNIYQDRQDNSFPDTGTYPLLFSGTIILSHKSKKCQAHCICRLFKKTEDLGACRIGSHIACSHIVDKCLQYHSTHCSDRIHNGNRQTFQCQSFDDYTLWFPSPFFSGSDFFPFLCSNSSKAQTEPVPEQWLNAAPKNTHMQRKKRITDPSEH